jgi:Protein of unknown function (DUF3631)
VNLDDLDTAADGASVLDAVRDEALTRYVVFPSAEAADAVTLYAAATHVQAELEFAARLVIKSPVKRCGKTRLLDVLAALVRKPLLTSDISAAALVRSISETDPPTIMLDEADATFGKALKGDEKAEHLRGILNAGFGRDRPYTRWDVTIRDLEDCPTFAMAVLAGIGSMPDTIEDRAIIISLRRKTAAEPVRKYRIRRDKPRVKATGDRLAEWAATIAAQAGKAEPDMPAGLDDRAEDVWEALLAIADLAGGDWPARARRAAQVLAGAGAADYTLPERLLADLRDVFGSADKLHGETILAELCKIDEAPWRDWYGHALNHRDLAGLLKPYGVHSADVKVGGINKRGYRRADLHEPWSRYLPPEQGGSATGATSATAQVSEPGTVAGSTQLVLPATADPPVTSAVAQVAEVAEPPAEDDLDWPEPGAAEDDDAIGDDEYPF